MDKWEGTSQAPSTFNKYAYVSADPVNMIDPSGYFGLKTALFTAGLRLMLNRAFVSGLAWAATHTALLLRVSAALSAVNLALLAASSEAREVFVATAGPDPLRVIAAEVSLVGSLFRSIASVWGRSSAAVTRNVINLQHNTGLARDFYRKAERLKRAARSGQLIYVGETTAIREASKQRAYRRRLERRIAQMIMSNSPSVTKDQALEQAKRMLAGKQVDHMIDLQISGGLADPNGTTNLGMLDGAVNGSVGKQIQLEAQRLGLQPGDMIDDVIW